LTPLRAATGKYSGYVTVQRLNNFIINPSNDLSFSPRPGDMFTIENIETTYLNLGVNYSFSASLNLDNSDVANKNLYILSVKSANLLQLKNISIGDIISQNITNIFLTEDDELLYNYYSVVNIEELEEGDPKEKVTKFTLRLYPASNTLGDNKTITISNNVYRKVNHNDEVLWTGDHWETLNYSLSDNTNVALEGLVVGKTYYYTDDDIAEEVKGGEIFNTYEETKYPDDNASPQKNTAKG
jgi:hypothetical protein